MSKNKHIRKLITGQLRNKPMPKTRAPAVPNTRTLLALIEEYQEMLRDAERGVKKLLALNPETEKFWNALTDIAPQTTLVGDRSDSVWEEIVDLIDQLPED